MRVLRSLFAALGLIAGAAVGALNREAIAIDFGPVALVTTLGIALIGAVLLGTLIGGAAVALGTPGRRPKHGADLRDASRPEV
ncbi:hypothetical protein [Cognatilysobacter bugurensis]|nr:hypothetical protein [Lysobacter bugurensis]